MAECLTGREPIETLHRSIAAMNAIDLTHPLAEGMPAWPGAPQFFQRAVSSMERRDAGDHEPRSEVELTVPLKEETGHGGKYAKAHGGQSAIEVAGNRRFSAATGHHALVSGNSEIAARTPWFLMTR